MNKLTTKHRTIRRDGKTYVLVEREEFTRLTGAVLPPLPKRAADGTVPAAEYVRASIARNIITRRTAAGLSQAQLAKLAGVRTETVNRIENTRHTPDVATIAKIDRALTHAGFPQGQ